MTTIKVDENIFNALVNFLKVFMLLPVSMRHWYYLNQSG